jgi:hypothetical protein
MVSADQAEPKAIFRARGLERRTQITSRLANRSGSAIVRLARVSSPRVWPTSPPDAGSGEIGSGSPDHAVAQVGHAWGLEHADELKCGLARLEAVE